MKQAVKLVFAAVLCLAPSASAQPYTRVGQTLLSMRQIAREDGKVAFGIFAVGARQQILGAFAAAQVYLAAPIGEKQSHYALNPFIRSDLQKVNARASKEMLVAQVIATSHESLARASARKEAVTMLQVVEEILPSMDDVESPALTIKYEEVALASATEMLLFGQKGAFAAKIFYSGSEENRIKVMRSLRRYVEREQLKQNACKHEMAALEMPLKVWAAVGGKIETNPHEPVATIHSPLASPQRSFQALKNAVQDMKEYFSIEEEEIQKQAEPRVAQKQ